jgi:hypothetical protein
MSLAAPNGHDQMICAIQWLVKAMLLDGRCWPVNRLFAATESPHLRAAGLTAES